MGAGIRGLGLVKARTGSATASGYFRSGSPIADPESPPSRQRLCQRAAVRIDHPRVPARTVLRGALLGAVVDVHAADALAVAERPFEVVHPPPDHVAAHVEASGGTILDPTKDLSQVAQGRASQGDRES